MSAVKVVALAVLFLSLFSPPAVLHAPPTQGDRPVVVLSPGHGWKDGESIAPGAVSGDLIEKDVNLDVARHAREYLERCDIDVYLTRTGDDPTHTLDDVARLVNDHRPTLGVSIHANSGSGNPSGTEGWYTVGGHNDSMSEALAMMLASAIASHMDIPNRGVKPETQSQFGGLYIHDWAAPSALVEVRFLQGDAGLLSDSRPEFGRAIAQAIVEYLGMPLTCGDRVKQQGLDVATYFPGDTSKIEISLLNDGLTSWRAESYALSSASGHYGAAPSYPLSADTQVGEIASWQPALTAPANPGVYVQVWNLERDGQAIPQSVTAYIIVVPEEARDLKQDIDARIEEVRNAGEEALEKLVEDLRREAMEWVANELPDLVCRQVGLLLSGALGMVMLRRARRKSDPTHASETSRRDHGQ